jgi:hypothetical protein
MFDFEQRGGQIDCWPMDCPPVQCEHPIFTPGDCCPRCEDVPCPLHEGNGSDSGLPCPYAGHYVVSGSEWRIAGDNCTSCRCKVSTETIRKQSFTHSSNTPIHFLIIYFNGFFFKDFVINIIKNQNNEFSLKKKMYFGALFRRVSF